MTERSMSRGILKRELRAVAPASMAMHAKRIELKGRIVSLLPLNPEAHGDALWGGVLFHDYLWDYLGQGPFSKRRDFEAHLNWMAASEDPFFLVILDNTSKLAVGYASYLRIELTHRVIEVGNILYTPQFQKTAGATEAMYLMARYAFEELGYRRYEWKCDSQNTPSRRAALRLGFQFEGIFRQHMIVKGKNRDTAWFSTIDKEWPVRKKGFESWLAPANFDEQGRQRVPLSSLNLSGA